MSKIKSASQNASLIASLSRAERDLLGSCVVIKNQIDRAKIDSVVHAEISIADDSSFADSSFADKYREQSLNDRYMF